MSRRPLRAAAIDVPGRSSIDAIAVPCFESNERKFGRGYTFLFAFHAAQYKLSSIQSYVQ